MDYLHLKREREGRGWEEGGRRVEKEGGREGRTEREREREKLTECFPFQVLTPS